MDHRALSAEQPSALLPPPPPDAPPPPCLAVSVLNAQAHGSDSRTCSLAQGETESDADFIRADGEKFRPDCERSNPIATSPGLNAKSSNRDREKFRA
eukprot:2914767-Rhodomonas_salina.1